MYVYTCIYIYPRGPRFSDDRTPVVAPLQMITLYHAPRQGRVGWGGVYYRSWNVDHVVDAPLQMITLYHAPRQGGIIVRGNFPIEVAPWHVTGGIECRELEYQALDDFWFVNHLIDFDDCSMVITEIINAYLMMIYWNCLD